MSKLLIGKLGEEIAASFLKDLGYKVIERSYRSGKWGEIDIICTKDNTLVFVEVKTRTTTLYGNPETAITFWKKRALKRAALYYCKTHKGLPEKLRMDVIAILLDVRTKIPTSIKHYKNAF